MLGLDSVDSVAHVIQVALTPVFLLSGIASLLGVLSTRLARVADRVDVLAEQAGSGRTGRWPSIAVEAGIPPAKVRTAPDAAVMMGTLGGVATSCAGLLCCWILRDRPGVALFVAFGLALLFTMGALVAFLIEMLLASRGLRDQADRADEVSRPPSSKPKLRQPCSTEAFEVVLTLGFQLDRHFLRDPGQGDVGLSAAKLPERGCGNLGSGRPCRPQRSAPDARRQNPRARGRPRRASRIASS